MRAGGTLVVAWLAVCADGVVVVAQDAGTGGAAARIVDPCLESPVAGGAVGRLAVAGAAAVGAP